MTWRRRPGPVLVPPRPSTRALVLVALLLAGWMGAAVHARVSRSEAQLRRDQARDLVRALDLTDMAWFAEARYTRHPAMVDLHSAFQDGPGLPEHFPAGSLMPPPSRLLEPSPAPSDDTGR